MRAYVFTDEALARHAGRFVWLDIDTDRPENAAFLEQYPIDVWPTFLVIDAKEERAVLRFGGSATVAQLERLFADGERAWRGDAQGAEALLARADSLAAAGRSTEAVEAFFQALAEAPGDGSRRGRALESLLLELWKLDRYEDCARAALVELPRVPRSASWANVTGLGLGCALEVPADSPASAELRTALEARAREALAPPSIEMPADDRSGVYSALVSARQAAEDAEGVKVLAEEWLGFLEGEAARAKTPEARTVFDSHRISAAMALGRLERVVPALEQSERELPADYNPPARLALLYRKLGRLDEALAASDRALAKVQGGRRLRVLSERAELHLARGEKEAAVRVLEAALAHGRTLSEAQVSRRQLEALERKLAGLR